MKLDRLMTVGFWLRQSAKLKLERSLLPILGAIAFLTGCENIFPKAVERVDIQPQAHHAEGKTSVYLRGVETQGDLIVLDLLAINAHDEAIELSDESEPLLLIDNRGNQYTAAEREISLQPYTSNNFKIAFAGTERVNGDLTLKINSDNDYILTPQMTVEQIPIEPGKRIEFASYQPRQVKLSDTVFHHPNGLTITVKDIKFYEQNVEVEIEAVNGYDNMVDLAEKDWDLPFFADESGNKYSYVPINANQLSIPPQQTARGTLQFAGRVPKSVSQLNLYFNEEGSDDDRTERPKIVFADLPGPGSLEASEIAQTEGKALPVSTSTTSSVPYEQGLGLQVNHPDGSVLRLNRIAVTDNYLETDLTITNGYRDAITLNTNNRDLLLRDNLGNTYNIAPAPQNPEVEVKAGDTLKGTFRFLGRIDPNARSLTLVSNEGHQNYTNTSRPYFAIANIPVTGQEQDTPNQAVDNQVELPGNLTLDLQANHSNGSVMRLKNISFQEDNIVAELAITNGYQNEIYLNNSRDMLLRDNLGNVYNLATLPQNPQVKIAPGQTLTGKFVFLGRISPQANSLTLATNDKYGLDTDYATRPKMVISSIAVGSSQPTVKPDSSQPSPQPISNKAIEQQVNTSIGYGEETSPSLSVNHPNGSVLQVKTLSFKDDSIIADLSVTNGHENEIVLNQSRDMLLRDNLGNVYHLATLPQNPDVKIPPGQTLTGKFVFLGRLSPQANSLTLVTNDEYGSDRDYARDPKMMINISLN
jgi:hypothetical protein